MMSTVIKAGQAGALIRQLSTVDLADHLAEARTVVQHAKRQASQIVSQAGEDARRAVEEGEKSGYEAGYSKGYEEGTAAGHQAAYEASIERFDKEHANVVAATRRAVDDFEAMKEEIRLAAERDVLEFAVDIARRLTFAIGRLHHESVVENLGRALRLVGSKTDLTIRVNPEDAESIRTFAESVFQRTDSAGSVNVVEDASISPGGCKVSSEHTDVDAALETQMDQIVTLLLGDTSGNA
jgi:flagellar assembly protein FliH